MQLLGADSGGDPRPGNHPPTVPAPGFGVGGMDLPPAPAGRWSRMGRGARRGSRVRARIRTTRGRLRRITGEHGTGRGERVEASLPTPLLTPPLAIPNPLRDRPARHDHRFDTLAFGTDRGGIPWPRPAVRPVPRPAGPHEDDETPRARRTDRPQPEPVATPEDSTPRPDEPDAEPDRATTPEPDTAEWEQPGPMAIDLSDGPKLIHRPRPMPPSAPPTLNRTGDDDTAEASFTATNPTGPGSFPFDPTASGTRAVSPEDLLTAPAIPKHPTATTVPTSMAVPVSLTGSRPGSVGSVGVDLSPVRLQPVPESRRIPEAVLVVVLSMIATATAWAIAAPPEIWLALAALPAAGLLALLPISRFLPAMRVLRATVLFGAAAALPVLAPAMTPVSLVIVLATVASYPLLLGPVAGRLVTGLAVLALAGALTGRTLLDGPARIARLLLHPQDSPLVGIQIALGSGILVAALVGITSTTARRRLVRAASAALAAERRARAEAAALVASSSIDPATGLPNRDGLLRAVAITLTEPDPITRGSTQPPVGLVLADLDGFDALADSLGPAVADDLAAQAGLRIADAFGDLLVGRVGRGQFALVLTDDVAAPNADTCADVARTVTRLMHEPVLTSGSVTARGGREFGLTCSLGGAISGPGLVTAEDLLQAADEAVRAARRGGRGRWSMFDRAERARALLRAGLEQELRQAVLRGLIEVDFQPMLALGAGLDDDDHITGAEALPRWRRQDGTTADAQAFVPLADELGLGVALGLQTINRALAALVVWRHEGVGVEQVWVGLSPAQLADPDFAHEVAAQLAIRGLTASSLVLQVNAGELEESGPALVTLGMLRSLGIPVALADFGRGGTSLTMLRRLPIDAVKLDGRLAAELGEPDEVVRAAAHLCHTLGLRVVCGSVETAGQLEGARRIGADVVQGQAIARAMPAQDVTNLFTLRLPRALRR
ncbi:EAL domain-containing protein [Kineosporia sp. J2-2]|uniref:EAL domain-containing protein n=1 Tax=Kineosporia corallincola TaxID=2835133 RepID=A0ABS5T9K2_9ACTN|nr:GGDEF and EAL domain-containing protein [Kineosporia corallincola]MBT0767755.1 EAL domain-containing protein [Kineosporia corallincola]